MNPKNKIDGQGSSSTKKQKTSSERKTKMPGKYIEKHVDVYDSMSSEYERILRYMFSYCIFIPTMYPHQTDTVQINALEYDPDIDGDNQPNTDRKHATVSIQGTLEMIPESSVLEDDNSIAPENNTAPQNQQETDWPDAPTIQISGVSSTTSDQPPEVMYNRHQVQSSTVDLEIPELEDNLDQDQFADLDTFIMHHNTHQANERI